MDAETRSCGDESPGVLILILHFTWVRLGYRSYDEISFMSDLYTKKRIQELKMPTLGILIVIITFNQMSS